jgi:vitamin B12 transporter
MIMIPFRTRHLLGALALATIATTSAAPAATQTTVPPEATDTIALPGLVVTATRVPLPREALPTPVTVLTGAELRERGIATVGDALRTVPGVHVARAGQHGAQTSLFLRGGQSGYVKVLVDGVAVNDPGGAIDLADLTTDQVERIEIVRGPASVLYGSDAVTGVVQVFTRRGGGGAPTLALAATAGRGERRYEDGGFGTLEGDATLSGSAGGVRYMVGGGRSWNEGAYPFNSDRRLDALNARLDWTAPWGTELSVTGRFTDSDTGFPTDGSGALVNPNARLERRGLTTGLEAAHRLGDRVTLRGQLGLLDRSQLAHDDTDEPGGDFYRLAIDLTRLSADARLDIELPGSIASIGAALQNQQGTTAYRSRNQWGPFDADAEFSRRNLGYYAQLLSEPVPGLHVTLGGRLDENEVFGAFQTYRLGAAYVLGASRFRAAAGRAFREPTFAESFGSGFGDTGNPGLVPERAASWEVGAEQRIGPLLLGASWFDQVFEDLIQFTFATDGPNDPNYYNVAAAESRGLELTSEVTVRALTVGASYTRLHTGVLDPGLATDAGFVEGQPLLRRPASSGAFTGRYRFHHGSVGLTLNAVGEREDLDFGAGFPAPRVTLPSYTTVDLATEARLPLLAGPPASVLLRVENLLDAEYEGIRGFPAPGRLITLGVRILAGPRR